MLPSSTCYFSAPLRATPLLLCVLLLYSSACYFSTPLRATSRLHPRRREYFESIFPFDLKNKMAVEGACVCSPLTPGRSTRISRGVEADTEEGQRPPGPSHAVWDLKFVLYWLRSCVSEIAGACGLDPEPAHRQRFAACSVVS